MATDDFNYYKIVRTNLGEAPDLMEDFTRKPTGCDFLNMAELAVENEIAHLQFEDEDKYPKLDTDYFELELAGVFSKKIVDVLSNHMPIHGLQLVPAEIKDNNNKIINDYWITNIYQKIASFDETRSVFRSIHSRFEIWRGTEKVVLDKDKLSKIPLEERLVYMAKEGVEFQLYHQSIVDIIGSVKPKGFVFVPIEEWYPEIICDANGVYGWGDVSEEKRYKIKE